MNYLRLFLTFVELGTFAFGGGYAIVVIAERILVRRLKWITERELMDYLAMSQSLSGIIALNLSGFIGYRRAGRFGALLAILGVLFTPFMMVLLIANLMNQLNDHPILMDILWGVKIGVCALILSMAIRLIKDAVKKWALLPIILFLAAFGLSYGLSFSPVVPIILAAGFGTLYWLFYQRVFNT